MKSKIRFIAFYGKENENLAKIITQVNGVILTLQKRYFLDVLDHLYCVSHTSAFYHIYSSRGRKTHNGTIQILRNIDFYPFEPHQPSL